MQEISYSRILITFIDGGLTTFTRNRMFFKIKIIFSSYVVLVVVSLEGGSLYGTMQLYTV